MIVHSDPYQRDAYRNTIKLTRQVPVHPKPNPQLDALRQSFTIKRSSAVAARTKKRGDRVTQYHYTVVFEPALEGGYVVSVPALPGLVTEGDTLEEARAMVKDAIRGYIESLVKHGEEIPIESGTANVERVEVTF